MKVFARKLRKIILDFYDSYLAFSFVGDVRGSIENKKSLTPINKKFSEFGNDGEFLDLEILIAAKRGLFLYSDKNVFQLFDRKSFYGIAIQKNRVFAFHQTGLHGKIISFQLIDNRAVNVKTIIYGLSKGVHQIDIIGKDLYVANTYQNSILVYKNIVKRNNIHWKQYDEILYPNGRLLKGRKSQNYAHFNSIYAYKGTIYLVAHNETKKTKKSSEIFCLNKNRDVVEKIDMSGSNCHNIYKDDETEIYCKSLESKVSINKKDILKYSNILTRGLSVAKDYLIVGGSDIEFDRDRRDKTNGYVFIYDMEYKLLQKVTIPNTQVQDIRRIHAEE